MGQQENFKKMRIRCSSSKGIHIAVSCGNPFLLLGLFPEQKTRNSVRALRSNNDYAKVECRLQANARMFARDVRALRVKSYAFDPFESVYIARKENLSNKIFLRLGLNRSKCTEKEISKRALRTSARLATMPFAR